ncbi:DUF294 nucleotidyltransferase-like domain-containing protein [Bacillus sinesaloumensis]|uniref:DUF294 nucleotidyltransferase-like domain-containing protein n=1 Tax=Litchfieldia sinesaloumensis TaxID=1926280 RepID=UPI0009885FCE|nr:DUF294 nucleotidyltransferase-like domain-containing protein [Bacillus sinesaloumensis]
MERLYEMVKEHPFFQGLSRKEGMEFLSLCKEITFTESDLLFQANEQRKGILLLLSGVAEVFVGPAESREVLEILKPGELIGLSSIAELFLEQKQNFEYRVGVIATEDGECLIIPNHAIKERLHDSNFHHYLFTQLAIRLREVYSTIAEQVSISRKGNKNGALIRRVQELMSKKLVSVEYNDSISTAAKKMTENNTSSVLVLEEKKFLGIITERDFVSRVISEQKSGNLHAAEIMTVNPVTISKYAYCYEALSVFILQGVKHLPVIENDEVVGIITLSDVLRQNKDNMMRTIKTIESATLSTLPAIRTAIYEVVDALLQDDVPIFKVLGSVTKLYDRLVKRCIDMAIEKISKRDNLLPPSAFCFYQMGSAGRAEQFLITDQDHFLVYEASTSEADDYFSKLGEEIVHLLEEAGFARCLGDMMASNPDWRGSLDTWMGRVRTWSVKATNQNMLLAQNFFSFRFLYGDERLNVTFEERLNEEVEQTKILLYRLHEIEKSIPSLDHPIRALFKLDRKQLDIKKEILFPYHHCLQILSLEYGIISGTPFERIDRLVEKNAFNPNFGKDIKSAASEVIRVYVKQRWRQHKNKEELTSILHFSHLSTKEKEELILSVKILREIQTLVKAHFAV